MKKTIGMLLALAISLYVNTPLNAAMEVTPRFSVGTEYTDNVRLAPDNTESDYISTITPGITLNIYSRAAGLAISYDPSLINYYDDSYEDYWRHAANLDGFWQAGRNTRFSLTNAFLKTEDPISDDDLTVRRSRNPYIRNTTNFGLEQQFGAENTISAAFEHSLLDNDDPTIDDSQRYVPSLGLTYWLNVRWGLDLTAVYTRAEYDVLAPDVPDDFDDLYGQIRLLHRFNRKLTGFLGYAHTTHKFDNADDDPTLTDYTVNDASVGFDYDIDATSDLSVSVNYFERDLDDDGSASDDPAVPVNVDYTKAFQRGGIALNVGGGYNYTSVTAENLGYYVYYGGGLNANYQFTRRITGDLFGRYQWRDYRDDPLGREDDVFRAGCGLSYEILRWLSMRVGYLYRTVESTDEVNDYKENRVSLRFTLAPPQPYRIGQ
jgi:hypothetical protein